MHQDIIKKTRTNNASQSCLRRYGGGDNAQFRLVCFPWAGAGASVYRRFAYHLSENIEIFAVQYPGREDCYNESRLRRMEDIVRYISTDIRTLIDHHPIIFFGHSMGALVAYEVAQSLNVRSAWQPNLLIASGSGSPAAEGTYERCSSNANDQELIAEMQRLGGTSPELLEDPQMMKTLLPVIRADYEVLDHYVSNHATPLSCPLITCAGDRDSSVSEKTLEMWRECVNGSYQKFWFSGDHFYFSSKPVSLLRNLEQWILQSKKISKQESIMDASI